MRYAVKFTFTSGRTLVVTVTAGTQVKAIARATAQLHSSVSASVVGSQLL